MRFASHRYMMANQFYSLATARQSRFRHGQKIHVVTSAGQHWHCACTAENLSNLLCAGKIVRICTSTNRNLQRAEASTDAISVLILGKKKEIRTPETLLPSGFQDPFQPLETVYYRWRFLAILGSKSLEMLSNCGEFKEVGSAHERTKTSPNPNINSNISDPSDGQTVAACTIRSRLALPIALNASRFICSENGA